MKIRKGRHGELNHSETENRTSRENTYETTYQLLKKSSNFLKYLLNTLSVRISTRTHFQVISKL